MPGFQSQTLNIRKVPTYPNQQLFGTFSNRQNSANTTNSVITTSDNYGSNLPHLVASPQNMNLFCPENKRASYDGSYGIFSYYIDINHYFCNCKNLKY